MISSTLMSYFVSCVIAGEIVLFGVLQAAGRKKSHHTCGFGWFYFTLCVGLFAVAGMSLLAYIDTLRKLRDLDIVGARFLAATDMLNVLRDMETGHRGFLLTGRGSYLEPYRKGLAEYPAVCRKIRDLYANSDGATAAAQVCKLGDAKIKEMSETLALREQHRDAEALEQFNSDVGRNTMDLLRVALGELLNRDRGRYNAIKADLIVLAEGRIIMAVLVAGGAVVQMFLGAFGMWQDQKKDEKPKDQPAAAG